MAVPFGTVALAWDNAGNTRRAARKLAAALILDFISVTSEEVGWLGKVYAEGGSLSLACGSRCSRIETTSRRPTLASPASMGHPRSSEKSRSLPTESERSVASLGMTPGQFE